MHDGALTVPAERCGPPDVVNGGYLAGLLAERLGRGGAEVTLRAPAPVASPLRVQGDGERVALYRDDTLLAEARPLRVAPPELPDPPSYAQAREGAGRCRAFETHPFPRCWVCGPERGEGDGLRIFPGRVPGGDRVAAAWRPPHAAGGDGRHAERATLWAALDCPTSFPLLEDPEARRLEPMVLGRISASLDAPVRAGEPHVIVAWGLGLAGRRGESAAALYDAQGRALAWSRATWLSLAA